jgi:hypothetical protein
MTLNMIYIILIIFNVLFIRIIIIIVTLITSFNQTETNGFIFSFVLVLVRTFSFRFRFRCCTEPTTDVPRPRFIRIANNQAIVLSHFFDPELFQVHQFL